MYCARSSRPISSALTSIALGTGAISRSFHACRGSIMQSLCSSLKQRLLPSPFVSVPSSSPSLLPSTLSQSTSSIGGGTTRTKRRPLDRLEALAAARRRLVLAAAGTPSSCRRTSPPPACRCDCAISAPPRQTSSSSSLMPMTPLPTPDRMLISSIGKWMTWPVRRRQEQALLVARAPSPSPPCRLRSAGRSAGPPWSTRCGTAPAASAASGPGPSPPAGTARPARRWPAARRPA